MTPALSLPLPLAAAPAALTALAIVIIVACAIVLALGTVPAYWAARVTRDTIKDKRVLAVIETGAAWAEQAVDKPERYQAVEDFVLAQCPWADKTMVKAGIEGAVLQLHKDLGLYDAQLEAAGPPTVPRSRSPRSSRTCTTAACRSCARR